MLTDDTLFRHIPIWQELISKDDIFLEACVDQPSFLSCICNGAQLPIRKKIHMNKNMTSDQGIKTFFWCTIERLQALFHTQQLKLTLFNLQKYKPSWQTNDLGHT